LMASLVAGCVSVGRKLDQSAVDRIKKGETTREEVLKSLGSPDQMMRIGNGDVTFHYSFHWQSRPEVLGQLRRRLLAIQACELN
jgi:outer membrane protein assembly factor BamE (lipoprotein component of BamABCDE complex)